MQLYLPHRRKAWQSSGATPPTYISTAQTVDLHKDTTALNMPSHVADDILLLMSVAEQDAWDSPDPTTPSGWTLFKHHGTDDNGGLHDKPYWIMWKRATSASETITLPANYTGGGPSRERRTRIACFRGAITTGDPWDSGSAFAFRDNAADMYNPAATPTLSDCLVIYSGAYGQTQQVNTDTPTGWTRIGRGTSPSSPVLTMNYRDAASVASTEVASIRMENHGNTADCVDITWFLKPAT